LNAPHPAALAVTELRSDMDVTIVRFRGDGSVEIDIASARMNSMHVNAVLPAGVMGIVRVGGLKTYPYTQYGVPLDRTGPWDPSVCMVPLEVAEQLYEQWNAQRHVPESRQLISTAGSFTEPPWVKK
jgi:hypothetical protein